MSNWVLSVASIVILSCIITMLLPEGKLSKYIKTVFGIVVILVMVQPVLNIKSSELNFDLFYEREQIVFQKDYLLFASSEKIKGLEENCEKILDEKGFNNVKVSINYNTDELGQAYIEKVILDFNKEVIISDKKHIDIIEDIISPISKYLNIDEKQVYVIE